MDGENKMMKLSTRIKIIFTTKTKKYTSSSLPYLDQQQCMTGVSFWNNNKTNMVLSELLTVTGDEAFIHLCMVNYTLTWWKEQEKQKSGEKNIQVPVSENHCEMMIL
jgi:serine protease inhibitor